MNPLYSALHGPAANDQSMLYYIDKKLQKRVTVCNKVLKHCVNPNVLYLYHGRRYCAEKESITGDNNLFDNFKDASTVEYPKHEEMYEFLKTSKGVKDSLRDMMYTPNSPDEQLRTLFAKDIVGDDGDCSTGTQSRTRGSKSFSTLTESQLNSSQLEKLVSMQNKKQKLNEQ